jgi:hypothetical protein
MSFALRLFLLLGLSLFLASGERSSTLPKAAGINAGIKMTVRLSGNGPWFEHTMYIRADARREEYRGVSGHRYGPHMAGIERCDLDEAFTLNLDQQEYRSWPYPPRPLTKEELAKSGMKTPQAAQPGPPTLRIEESTVDTGERKDFFGHVARHVITTRKETPLEGAHREADESVTDGWYIDLDTRIACDRRWPEAKHEGQKAIAYLTTGDAPPERIEAAQKGEPERGFPVEWRISSKSEFTLSDGTKRTRTSKEKMQIVEFMEGPLDPALFEVPAGFKKVARIDSNEPGEEQSVLRTAWQRLADQVDDLLH